MRPCEILANVRMRRTLAETPRTCTLASVPVLINGNGMTPTTSCVTSGPAESRAIPGASCTIFTNPASRRPSFPRSNRRAERARCPANQRPPVSRWNPRASESMATKTPTVPGNAEHRDNRGRPARLDAAKVVSETVSAMSDPPQRFTTRRRIAPNARQECRSTIPTARAAHKPKNRQNRRMRESVSGSIRSGPGAAPGIGEESKPEPEQAPDQRNHQRFRKHEKENRAIRSNRSL